jgi:hypothetical protein
MKPFELRLAEHHSRNRRHLKNLENFVNDNTRFSQISEEEQHLIEIQIGHMRALDTVLESRMIIHKIPV